LIGQPGAKTDQQQPPAQGGQQPPPKKEKPAEKLLKGILGGQ
jgi:hypothetical protein